MRLPASYLEYIPESLKTPPPLGEKLPRHRLRFRALAKSNQEQSDATSNKSDVDSNELDGIEVQSITEDDPADPIADLLLTSMMTVFHDVGVG